MDVFLDIFNVEGQFRDPDYKGSEDTWFPVTFEVKSALWSRGYGYQVHYIAPNTAAKCIKITGMPKSYYDQLDPKNHEQYCLLKDNRGLLNAEIQVEVSMLGSAALVEGAIKKVTGNLSQLQKEFGRPGAPVRYHQDVTDDASPF